jgi:hypothetical protein
LISPSASGWGYRRGVPHTTADLDPAYSGEHQVQKNEVIGQREGKLETGIAVICTAYFVSLILQMEFYQMSDIFVIFNNKDSSRHVSPLHLLPSSSENRGM